MYSEYIKNGRANRGAIASAVRFRKLKRAEIEELCAKSEVRSIFISDSFSSKRPPREWDKAYLNSLHGAYSGCFNRDYLLYLDEVADYVSKATFRKVVIAGVVIVLVIIAGVVIYSYVQSAKATELAATAINEVIAAMTMDTVAEVAETVIIVGV